MLEFLYKIDLFFFYFINHNLSNKGFDKFFAFITSVDHWLITYVFVVLLLLIKGGKKERLAALFVLLMIIVTDQTGARFLKEFFGRIRPCGALPDVLMPIGCTGSPSFPSNHALNNFAVATFFTRLYPNLKIPLFVVASLIAFSRVYLGVHYPSDIIGGAIIGIGAGLLFAFLHSRAAEYHKE